MSRIYFLRAFSLLTFSVTYKMVTGNCTEPSMKANQVSLQEERTEMFDLHEDAYIKCTNRTWSEMIYSIWKLRTKKKHCCMSLHFNESKHDMCMDGKELMNTSKGESYLHIPGFTLQDEGTYFCEIVYWGGDYSAEINISARVAPQTYSRFYEFNGRRIAMCSAVGGKPAASISWRPTWNSTNNQTLIPNPDGTYTVESHLVLPENVSSSNVSCVITHPGWQGGQREIRPEGSRAGKAGHWIWPSLVATCAITVILTAICLAQKYFSKISTLIRNCCKISIPTPVSPKSVQDVEELEPYASYVQRVNSIYNSSAELCNH